ncbi:MAG: response regulator, partial [Verrucomicrobiota bacterium]
KIEAGKLEMESISFSLREAVGAMLKPLSIRADRKHLELVADIPASVPDHLIGDPMRLRQILLNLTDNAIKFTERGEIIVKIAIESAAQDETELHFSVTDSGIGIPVEKQAAIFEAFAQVDGSTTRQYGGTGLGLAIATRLVHQMRGRLWVESRVGFGTTFHFTIRLRTSAESMREIKHINPANLDGLRVLIVDDNAVNCRILKEMLSNWRMQPTVVRSAAAALVEMQSAVAAGRPFPLVLLDAMMPGTDGFALAERIKDEPGLTGATVMMLSSAMRAGETSRATGLNIHSILTKPVMQSDLLDAILASLDGNALAAANNPLEGTTLVGSKKDSLQILVVEDNAINRAVASGMLEKEGHTLTHAANGLEAIAAVTTKCFDLILMDVQMPEMDGFQATARIRELEKMTGRHTPIIAMTAHAMVGDRERCIAAGMDDYISKPLGKEDLFRALAGEKGQPGRKTKTEKATVQSRAELLAQFGEDEDLLRELIALFREDTPRLFDVIHEAIVKRDAPSLAAGAHKLLSSLGAFGAENAHNLTQQLEEQGRQANFERAEKQVIELGHEIDRIHTFLAGYPLPRGGVTNSLIAPVRESPDAELNRLL